MEELNKLAEILSAQIKETIGTLNAMNGKANETEYVHKLGELAAYSDIFRVVMITLEKEN